jgi:hypothetical protein
MAFKMPHDFKFAASFDLYDGSKDPLEHVELFETSMNFQEAT